MGFLTKDAVHVGQEERVAGRGTTRLRPNPPSSREAGLVTDKAVGCEPVHTGAWEPAAQRGPL